jgi:hypothetical protein
MAGSGISQAMLSELTAKQRKALFVRIGFQGEPGAYPFPPAPAKLPLHSPPSRPRFPPPTPPSPQTQPPPARSRASA